MTKDELQKRIRVGGDVARNWIFATQRSAIHTHAERSDSAGRLRRHGAVARIRSRDDRKRSPMAGCTRWRIRGEADAGEVASKYEGKPGYKVSPPLQGAPVQNKAAL